MIVNYHRLALAALTAAFAHFTYTYGTMRTEHGVTIRYKHPANNKGQYFVFLEQHGWHHLTPNIWLQLDDRTDLYQQLQYEKPYSLRVYGWRIKQLGLYPNIVQVLQPATNNRTTVTYSTAPLVQQYFAQGNHSAGEIAQ